jgi:hypothetical protein
VKGLSNGQVVLSPALQRALVQHFPEYHRVGDHCTGDFDGNGLEDVALYLTNRRRAQPFRQSTWLLVAFHQTAPETFRPYIIARRRDPSTMHDRNRVTPGRFADHALFSVLGGFPYVAGRHRIRQMTLRHDGIVEHHMGLDDPDDTFEVWFFQGGQYHGVREVGGFGE